MSPSIDARSNSASFERGVRRCIPSDFTMISGSADGQEAEEIYNAAAKFDLPDVRGKEGGLCTSLLLQALYRNTDRVVASKDGGRHADPVTCRSLLGAMYESSRSKGYTPVPQMTASRPLESSRPFYIVPPGATGRRRALIIGINYTGQPNQLRAPHNDAHNVHQFLVRRAGFDPAEMLLLLDDGHHAAPTKRNIQMGMQQMTRYSQPGDVLVVSFSGHGGRVRDTDGDEEDGYDSSLMPVDFASAGQIVDDDILKYFIKAIPAGVHTTMIVDACHCGSVGDLPYTLAATDSTYQIEQGFNMDTFQEAVEKDKAAYEAEQERKQQKAQRQKEREAIRQRRAEEETREAAMVLASSSTGHPLHHRSRKDEPSHNTVIEARSPAELHAIAKKYGSTTGDTPGPAVTLSKQGKQIGTVLVTSPVLMTPEKAAAFQAKYSSKAVSGPKVVVGSPQVVSPRASGVSQGTSANKRTAASARTQPLATTSKKPIPQQGVTLRKTPDTTGTKKIEMPRNVPSGTTGVAALRSKFGG